MNTETKTTESSAGFPANWEALTRTQLEWLAEHGSYGQRLIANRHLRDWAKDRE